jgi:peptidoglycan hydrolase-like amidase
VAGDGFELSGRGEGHGEGMDLAAAERAAARGATFRDLIARFYPGARVVER